MPNQKNNCDCLSISFDGIAILLLPFGLLCKFVIVFAASPSSVQGATVSLSYTLFIRYHFVPLFHFSEWQLHPLPIILRAGATHCDCGIVYISKCSFFAQSYYIIPCIVQAQPPHKALNGLPMVLYHHFIPWYSLWWVLAACFRHSSSSSQWRLAVASVLKAFNTAWLLLAEGSFTLLYSQNEYTLKKKTTKIVGWHKPNRIAQPKNSAINTNRHTKPSFIALLFGWAALPT